MLQSMGLKESETTERLKNNNNDLAILLLGVYPEKTIIQKDTCTPKFTATVFTIART